MSNFSGKKYDKTCLTKEQMKRKQNQRNSKNTKKNQQINYSFGKLVESKADVYNSVDTNDRRHRMNAFFEEKSLLNSASHKKKYRGLNIFLLLFFVILSYFIYYQMISVYVPNLEGKDVSEVQQWALQNDLILEIEEKYDLTYAPNIVFKQSISEKKIKKNKSLVIYVSLGANPEENISLPNFTHMTIDQAKEWIQQEQANNIVIVEEYSDVVAIGNYLKFEMIDADRSLEQYLRKDKAKLYFSKGKEVFEKDIPLVNFVGKSKEEAVEWAQKNDIDLFFSESTSDKIEKGKIISQDISPTEKIAKQGKLELIVSIGREVTVPDFSQITFEELENEQSEFQVKIKQVYNDSIAYGKFISQSIEAGTIFQEKEKKPDIQVIYSLGKPYMRDLRNNTLEGELQKIFYDEYQSRGANVTYNIFYIESDATKGTVVQMSSYNEFIPTVCTVNIGVSKGKE